MKRLAATLALGVLVRLLTGTGVASAPGNAGHMGQEVVHPQDPRRSRILIADDHPLFRAALRQLLADCSGLEVVGEAEDGRDVVELCRQLRPDLVLMDVRMPHMDGLEATRAIKREFPQVIVLMLTAMADHNYLARALRAGAAGYVLKGAGVTQMTEAIRGALDGEHTLPQEVATRLLHQLLKERYAEADPPAPLARTASKEPPYEANLLELLTPREVDVLRLMTLGQTNQQIAQTLLISFSSVKKHVRRIISKLGVSDRVQAAVRATELGLLPAQDGVKAPQGDPFLPNQDRRKGPTGTSGGGVNRTPKRVRSDPKNGR